MDEDLFWHAVDEIVKCGANKMCPFINGDPFADPRMPQLVESLAKRHPMLDIVLYTNGLLATEDKIGPVIEAGNVSFIYFSIQGADPDVLKQNTGLDYTTVVDNLRRSVELVRCTKSKTQVRVTMCLFSKTVATLPKLKALANDLGIEACPGVFSNFGGMIHDEVGEKPVADWPRLVCDRATTHAYIYWDGTVGQCCFDLLGSVSYGNVRDMPLSEILNSDRHREMVAAHMSIETERMPEICRECNSPKFHG